MLIDLFSRLLLGTKVSLGEKWKQIVPHFVIKNEEMFFNWLIFYAHKIFFLSALLGCHQEENLRFVPEVIMRKVLFYVISQIQFAIFQELCSFFCFSPTRNKGELVKFIPANNLLFLCNQRVVDAPETSPWSMDRYLD